jgi:hypothetical protein
MLRSRFRPTHSLSAKQSLVTFQVVGRQEIILVTNLNLLLRSSLSLSMPADSSHREDLEQIARVASQPFSIVSVTKVLNKGKFLRGGVYLARPGARSTEFSTLWRHEVVDGKGRSCD